MSLLSSTNPDKGLLSTKVIDGMSVLDFSDIHQTIVLRKPHNHWENLFNSDTVDKFLVLFDYTEPKIHIISTDNDVMTTKINHIKRCEDYQNVVEICSGTHVYYTFGGYYYQRNQLKDLNLNCPVFEFDGDGSRINNKYLLSFKNTTIDTITYIVSQLPITITKDKTSNFFANNLMIETTNKFIKGIATCLVNQSKYKKYSNITQILRKFNLQYVNDSKLQFISVYVNIGDDFNRVVIYKKGSWYDVEFSKINKRTEIAKDWFICNTWYSSRWEQYTQTEPKIINEWLAGDWG